VNGITEIAQFNLQMIHWSYKRSKPPRKTQPGLSYMGRCGKSRWYSWLLSGSND